MAEDESYQWNAAKQAVEPVVWNAEERRYEITLYGVPFLEGDQGFVVHYSPASLFSTRIRNIRDPDFGPGFVSPGRTISFTSLVGGETYEAETQRIDPDTGRPIPGAVSFKQQFTAGESSK